MLSDFIDFVDSVLPSVSPDFRDGAKNAILQFEKTGRQLNYLMFNLREAAHTLEGGEDGETL